MNLEDMEEKLETDDVGQKRYVMYNIFDQLLEEFYSLKEQDLPEVEERVKQLNGMDGYIYKMAQEFLTSSSTMEKEQKLEKMFERVKNIR